MNFFNVRILIQWIVFLSNIDNVKPCGLNFWIATNDQQKKYIEEPNLLQNISKNKKSDKKDFESKPKKTYIPNPIHQKQLVVKHFLDNLISVNANKQIAIDLKNRYINLIKEIKNIDKIDNNTKLTCNMFMSLYEKEIKSDELLIDQNKTLYDQVDIFSKKIPMFHLKFDEAYNDALSFQKYPIEQNQIIIDEVKDLSAYIIDLEQQIQDLQHHD